MTLVIPIGDARSTEPTVANAAALPVASAEYLDQVRITLDDGAAHHCHDPGGGLTWVQIAGSGGSPTYVITFDYEAVTVNDEIAIPVLKGPGTLTTFSLVPASGVGGFTDSVFSLLINGVAVPGSSINVSPGTGARSVSTISPTAPNALAVGDSISVVIVAGSGASGYRIGFAVEVTTP